MVATRQGSAGMEDGKVTKRKLGSLTDVGRVAGECARAAGM